MCQWTEDTFHVLEMVFEGGTRSDLVEANLSNLILCVMNFRPLSRQWVLTKPDTLLGTEEMEIHQLSPLFLGIHNLMGETNINKFVFSEKERDGGADF